MGLFTKKDPCAICGGKVKALFPWKVEGKLVCNSCYGNVHLPEGVMDSMTLEAFQEYRAFRQRNDVQRRQFKATQQVDFGFFGEHFQFDTENSLFCPSIDLDKTIFEGKQIKSFVIREDNAPLFEGSATGLVCYNSTVTDRIIAMTPMIQQVAMMKRMQRLADRVADENDRRNYDTVRHDQDIPKPFEKFIVEIQCDHPYWKTITADKQAPDFNHSEPEADEYLRLYRDDAATMEKLARALMQVAFPGAPEQRVNRAADGQTATGAAAPADAVAEIQRFKDLMDQGIITEEEFTAKKRQLLGI